MYRSVEFQSEGATLRGRLYLPSEGKAPFPTIVMSHGITATITMVADKYAEFFCDSGFAVLLYDHRNFGASDGEPRREINPWLQARGFRDAMTFAEQAPEADESRLGLWGDSYSAGHALVVASIDPRVKALVVQCPSCGRNVPGPDPDGKQFEALRETLLNGDVSGTPETTAGPMPVVSFDQARHPAMLAPLTAYRWFMEYGGRFESGWENDATRVTPVTPAPFSPVLCGSHITASTLMMVAPGDEMAGSKPEVAKLVFDSLAGPKEWYDIAGGHFGLVWYPSEIFDEAVSVQRDFFLRNL